MKLKGSPYSIAEDFSKATLDIRRKLVQKGKEAKEKNPAVQNFTVKYRRLILTYLNPSNNKTFKWGFDVKDTEGSPQWFKPPSRNNSGTGQYNGATATYTAYSRVDGQGYQDSA